MIISTDTEKAFEKIQHPVKNSQQTRNRKEVSQLDKEHIQKPTAHIVLNGQKPEAFPLRSGLSQTCPLSTLLFNILLEFLAKATTGIGGRDK